MTRAEQRQWIAGLGTQTGDLAIGLGLCAVTVTRVLLGSWIAAWSWGVAAVAALACAALAVRRHRPHFALALASAGGVLAMSMDLRGSAVDLLLGLGLGTVALGQMALGFHGASPRPSGEMVAAEIRRRWPFVALAAAIIVGIAAIPVDLKEATAIAVLFTAYAVGGASDRTSSFVLGFASVAILAVGSTLVSADAWTGPDTPVPLIAVALIGVAVGDAGRSRRALRLAAEEEATRTRRAHEEEAQRLIVEERLHIAREVHDLVAHHLAVINVQAGVAGYFLDDRPEPATEALDHIRSASKAALDELATLLGVLRGAGNGQAPTSPTPRLTDLNLLLDSITAAGLQVERTIVGNSRPLPATVDLSAYRIIQESLTNAHKHGDGRARLQLSYTPHGLEIEVRNSCAAGRDSSQNGHGLAGMRERAAALGGHLEAGPMPGGEFVVKASFPIAHEGSGERG